MLLLGLFDVEEAIRYLMAWLCSFIYELIASLFELFINISKVELLKSKEITPIYQRVTMILTIIMVFYVTFELVKYIIQPDTMKDKEKGASKVVVRMILVVVLIAFVPTAFSLAYRLQNAIIEREVLSKVILGRSNTSSESFGRNFSADMFSLFYSFNEEYWGGPRMCDDIDCTMLVNINIDSLRTTGKLESLTYGLNETETKTEKGVSQDITLIRFDGLFAVLVGGFLIYVLILYCIDLGVRVAQITFLQIIAPIPIIGYLSPKKDNIFNKWVKQCTTTYLDLFIRLSLIYFVLLVCKIIADAYNNGKLIQNVDQDSKTYVYIAIILGLLLFAQKAPKMLQELFPKMGAASGNLGLKQKDRLSAISRTAGAAIGASRLFGGAVSRGVNTFKRNRRLTRDTGMNKKQRKEAAKAAKATYKNASKEYRKARRSKDENLIKEKRDAFIDAESAHAYARNKMNRSITRNAAIGAISGAWTGARIGFGTKEMKDINKKRKEGIAKDKSNIDNVEQWLNSGGYSEMRRMVSRAEQKVGITTYGGRMETAIKYYEGEIKSRDARAKIESDTKSTRDDIEKRLFSKTDDGSSKVLLKSIDAKDKDGNVIGKTIKGLEGYALDIREDDTSSKITERYHAKAEAARNHLDALTKNGASEDEIKTATDELSQAQFLEKAVRKHSTRNTFTQLMHDPKNPNNDHNSTELLSTMKNSVEIAKSNYPVMKEFAVSLIGSNAENEIRKIENDSSLSDSVKNAKIEEIKTKYDAKKKEAAECGNIESLKSVVNTVSFDPKSDYSLQWHVLTSDKGDAVYEENDIDYDVLDHVVVRFEDISKENKRRSSELSEIKRKYEASDRYAAEKSNDTSTKPSGK